MGVLVQFEKTLSLNVGVRIFKVFGRGKNCVLGTWFQAYPGDRDPLGQLTLGAPPLAI